MEPIERINRAKDLITKVEGWSRARNILSDSTIPAQYVKLVEESCGEACLEAINTYDFIKNNPDKCESELGNKTLFEKVMDACGDTVVVAINLAAMEGKSLSPEYLISVDSEEIVNTIDKVNVLYYGNKIAYSIGEIAERVARGKSLEDGDNQYLGQLCFWTKIFAQAHGFNLLDCLELSYNEIKDRKGLLVNGAFIKEADFTPELREQFKEQLANQL